MNHYEQDNPEWKDYKLGFGKTTFGTHGCNLMCSSMLVGEDPRIVNERLKIAKAYNVDLLSDEAIARVLNLKYDGKTTIKPTFPCKMEVDPQIPGYPQHFVVFLPLGDGDWIIDPLDGKKKRIPTKYLIKSYRLFHEKRPLRELIEDMRLGINGKVDSLLSQL